MPARKVSNSYYDGSAARKILPQEEKKQRLLELKEYINNMNQDNMSTNGGIKR